MLVVMFVLYRFPKIFGTVGARFWWTLVFLNKNTTEEVATREREGKRAVQHYSSDHCTGETG
jgi:hypothetical protein